MSKKIRRIPIDKIKIIGKRRPLNRRKCELIAESIRMIGLQTPITVRIRKDGTIVPVAGLHRLEAMKINGEPEIDCFVSNEVRPKRQLWQDGENLWRAGLTALEKAEAIARWTRNAKKLAKTNPGTVKGGKQPHDKGITKSARKLGLTRDAIKRAVKIDSIAPKAKEVAKRRGLNQDALLKIAKEATPEEQVRKVRELTTKPAPKRAPKKPSRAERNELRSLMRRLKKAKNLTQAISNASPFVLRKFAAEIVKLGRSSNPNQSASL
jgi:ParB family transcriptional regulator, chromosome partitioning protein